MVWHLMKTMEVVEMGFRVSFFNLIHLFYEYRSFVYMYIDYVRAWCPQRPEEPIGSPGAGEVVVSYHVGAGN